MAEQDVFVRRVKYFNHQLLQVQDFTDEQAYHVRMRRLHNRLLHSWGIAEGLQLGLDTASRVLTVEEGIAIDARGRELVFPVQQTFELSGYAQSVLWVTLAYGERDAEQSSDAGATGFSRTEEVPRVELRAAPPADPSLELVLGRVVAGPAGTAVDDGEGANRRRNVGGAGGDLEGRSLTLSGHGIPTGQWPRLGLGEPGEAQVEGALRVTGELRAGGGVTVQGRLGVGTAAPAGRLHVVNAAQEPGGDTLVLGPAEGAHLRLGYGQDAAWIQALNGPLRIGELGSDTLLNARGNGRVGVGTDRPTHPLHVGSSEDAVAAFESRGGSAFVRLLTREGMENRVEVAARPQGRLALWVASGGDVVNVTRDGRLGIGTEFPTHRFHVRADDSVGLFESIGEQAYLRLVTREGMEQRVELANRPGGRLALWVSGAGDALSISREGQVGIGTVQPQARLHVAGDLVVEGEIRSARGGGAPQQWSAVGGGLAYHGAVGVGTLQPEAKLQVIHTPQDSNGDALVLGPESGSNLRLGYHSEYSWIQSHGSRPLRINELGNDVVVNLNGGNVGIGTAPRAESRLHVKGDVFFEGRVHTAAGELSPGGGGGGGGAVGPVLNVATTVNVGPAPVADAEGRLHVSGKIAELSVQDRSTPKVTGQAGQRYVLYATEGRFRLWTEARGDLLSVSPEGRLGIGAAAPEARLQVVHTPQDSNGDSLILGPTGAANLRMGYHTEYSWIQSHGAKPLRINELGNDVLLNLNGGNVGLGTPDPKARLHVKGDVFVEGKVFTPAGELGAGGGGGAAAPAGSNPTFESVSFGARTAQMLNLWNKAYAIGIQNGTQYARTDANFAWFQGGTHANGELDPGGGTLRMVMNREGSLGIGTAAPRARLHVEGGAIMPAAGKGETAGILFPPDAGGGGGDRAWMRYYARAGEAMTLELGVSNDGDDHIALMASGNVGVGTPEPKSKLHVVGDLLVEGKVRTPAGELVPGGGGGGPIGPVLNVATTVNVGPTPVADAEGRLHVSGKIAELSVQDRSTPKVTGQAGQRYVQYATEGRFRLWTEAKGDLLNVSPDGRLSIGNGGAPATAQLHVKAADEQLRIEGPGDVTRLIFTKENGQSNWDVGVGGGRVPGNRDLWIGDFKAVRMTIKDGSGNVGIGAADPVAKLQVVNAAQNSDGNTLILGPTNGSNLRMGYNAEYSWIQSHGAKPLRINEIGNHVLIGLGSGNVGVGHDNPAAKLHVRGGLIVDGNIQVNGTLVAPHKQGFLADQFVNTTGDALEEGDVVVIGAAQPTLFYGDGGLIPVPEVDLTDQAGDRRVCGVVASAHVLDDAAAGLEPVSTAKKKRGAAASPAPQSTDDPRVVGPGQRGSMVTLGAFAFCKVDADLGAVEPGDLLTTSTTKGHAMKVDDPAKHTGAIVGKALAPLGKGRGKIPVMVMLQ